MNDTTAWKAQLSLSLLCFALGYWWDQGFYILGCVTILLGLLAAWLDRSDK